MPSSRNKVFHRKSDFYPTRKRVGFTPQFITRIRFQIRKYPFTLYAQGQSQFYLLLLGQALKCFFTVFHVAATIDLNKIKFWF